MAHSSVRVRFAPSPTGHLHIGGLRTALFNYFFARAHQGRYLVRIEDTDIARSKPEYVESIMGSLAWSGLMPDEPLVFQMSRLEEHKKAVQQLLDQNRAYRCFCPPSNTDLVQEQLAAGIASQYPGTCRNFKSTPEDLKRPHAIRFKVEKKEDKIAFTDLIRGELAFDYDQFDDFIIVRQDGTPTYNFVVVVDDIFMKISHVIRGEDHIYNTPKQIFLYQALNASVPQFAHLPLILSPNGGRLSKRDGAVSVVDYKKQGFLAPALCNYLARLGWSYKDLEIFTPEEVIALFSLDQISKSGAIFDNAKLAWVNSVYLKKMSADDLLASFNDVSELQTMQLKELWKHQILLELIDLYKERVSTTKELLETLIALAHDPLCEKSNDALQHYSTATKLLLNDFVAHLSAEIDWNEESLSSAGKTVLAHHKAKMPALGIPLRLALTGKTTSPGIFKLLALLPQKIVVERIKKFITLCD